MKFTFIDDSESSQPSDSEKVKFLPLHNRKNQ